MGSWLWIQQGVQFSGYSKRPRTLNTTRGSVLWIQPEVLALDTARGSPLWIQQVVLDLDTAIGLQYSGSGSGYIRGPGDSKGFNTPDTAKASVLWIQPEVLALDPTMDSGFINLGSIS
jgi:hypothetical protein